MVLYCKKCGSEQHVKAGLVKGEQRYKCKSCGCQFVPTRQHGKPLIVKSTAVLLYSLGLSMRTIALLFKVSPRAVLVWIRNYARENYERPKPASGEVVVELDEMWHFVHSKKTNFGFGRLIVEIPLNLSTGNAEGAGRIRLTNSISG